MNKKTITTYGGKIGWFLRRHFSRFTSFFWLKLQYVLRHNLTVAYIRKFREVSPAPKPLLISIETINRCNNRCSFCPASVGNESRPFKQMTDELFKKIISDLSDWRFEGVLSLYINNEPFMDKRITELHKYAKKYLPKCKILLFTNGKLLTLEKWLDIMPYVDIVIINDYTDKLKLSDNISKIAEYMQTYDNKEHPIDFKVQIRYIDEILTNRAGVAPNKKKKTANIKEPCLMPFTDIAIFPDGICGLCCSDATERTNLGNVAETTPGEIWESELYETIRAKIGDGRHNYDFCKGCDFVDAGIRNILVRNYLKGSER